MVMTRGCASRLLELSATCKLRVLLCGLVFAVAAQSPLPGVLAPRRLAFSNWWVVGPRAVCWRKWAPGCGTGWCLLRSGRSPRCFLRTTAAWAFWKWAAGTGTGLMVALAWCFTYAVGTHSFGPLQIQGLTFSGPSAERLMRVQAQPGEPWTFGLGLLPGVFLGALSGALAGSAWKIESSGGAHTMTRCSVGAVFMGFGSLLAASW